VFAEGLCIQERRLRPLKKGVSRMVFGAIDYLGENTDLKVVPVGINYSKPDKFRSTAFYNIGEPIPLKELIEEYKLNPSKANNSFLQLLAPKMKELITHINNKENDEAVYQIEELCKRDWIKEQGLNYKNLNHDFIVLKQLTEKVNTAEVEHPVVLAEFKEKANVYFNELKKQELRDWLINPKHASKLSSVNLIFRFALLVLGFPLYLAAIIGNYLPYKLTNKLTRKIVKNKEFYSSFAIALSMILFLINYSLWFTVSYLFFPTISMPIFICTGLVLCGWFSLYYSPFKKKTKGIYRILKNKQLYADLSEKRKELVSLINKF
jgi:hypothetical protein